MMISIIGAGNGGYAAAADLLLKGFKVKIYELPKYRENLFPMIEQGKIKMTGERQGITQIPMVCENVEMAMSDADVILVMTRANAHQEVSQMMAPYIESNQVIVLVPGYTGGALCMDKIFKEYGVSSRYILAETSTLPYACRKINGESAVHMKLYVERFQVSAFPSTLNNEFYHIFKQIYPNSYLVENVLETGFNNGNPILNVIPAVLNAGRIEYAKGEYYHHQEGITPSVAKVLKKIDKERVKIGERYGIKTIPYLERVKETGYVQSNESWYEAISSSHHLTAKGPDSLEHRYLKEDVPYGLLPWYQFSEKAKMNSDLLFSFIQIASLLNDENYFQTGRTLIDMGLHDIKVNDIRKYLLTGTI